MTPNNNSIATINQHLNNLGTINAQLSTLSQQLTGLNQQSQNLQHFQQNIGNNYNQLQQMSMMSSVPNLTACMDPSNYHSINPSLVECSSPSVTNGDETNANSLLHTNRMAKMGVAGGGGGGGGGTNLIQNDLFQSNQELLNRLQSLTLGLGNNNNNTSIINGNYSPGNSFMYTNANATSSLNGSSPLPNTPSAITTMANLNNNNLNLLMPSPSITSFTPSPVFSRSPYSSSPLLDNSSSLVLTTSSSNSINHPPSSFGDGTCAIDEAQQHQFIRPIATTPLNGTNAVLSVPEASVTKLRPSTPISLYSPEVWGWAAQSML